MVGSSIPGISFSLGLFLLAFHSKINGTLDQVLRLHHFGSLSGLGSLTTPLSILFLDLSKFFRSLVNGLCPSKLVVFTFSFDLIIDVLDKFEELFFHKLRHLFSNRTDLGLKLLVEVADLVNSLLILDLFLGDDLGGEEHLGRVGFRNFEAEESVLHD